MSWIIVGVGFGLCAVVLIFSRAARRQVRLGWSTLRDAETKRHERGMILVGVGLIVFGGVVPGPVDELIGIVLIGRVSRRVAARKAGR